MSQIQAVFSDIDGTLIHVPSRFYDKLLAKIKHKDLNVLDEDVVYLINYLKENGVLFNLITGRRFSGYQAVSPHIPHDYGILEHGGLILREGEIDTDWTKLIKDHTGDFELGESPSLLQRDGSLWDFARELEGRGIVLDYNGRHASFRGNPKQKELGSIDYDELKDLESRFGVKHTLNQGFMDFLPNLSGKEQAILHVLAREGIDLNTIACLGDGDNDIEMLELAQERACTHIGATQSSIDTVILNNGYVSNSVGDAASYYMLHRICQLSNKSVSAVDHLDDSRKLTDGLQNKSSSEVSDKDLVDRIGSLFAKLISAPLKYPMIPAMASFILGYNSELIGNSDIANVVTGGLFALPTHRLFSYFTNLGSLGALRKDLVSKFKQGYEALGSFVKQPTKQMRKHPHLSSFAMSALVTSSANYILEETLELEDFFTRFDLLSQLTIGTYLVTYLTLRRLDQGREEGLVPAIRLQLLKSPRGKEDETLGEALRYYERRLEISPNDIKALTTLGNFYDRQGQLELAQNYYQRLANLSNEYLELHKEVGRVRYQLGLDIKVPPILKKGDKTAEGFVLKEYLANGGSTEVWLAEKKIGEQSLRVAVKLAREHTLSSFDASLEQAALDGNLDSEELLLNGIKVLSKIGDCRHIVKAERPTVIVRKDGTYWVAVEEFVDGKTLNQFVTENELNDDKMTDLTFQIYSAMVVAHDAGVIHYDFKPSNIMVTNDQNVKVLDFGISSYNGKRIGYLNPAILPPHYLSEVDTQIDLWSGGLCLYHLLTGGRDLVIDLNDGQKTRRRSDIPSLITTQGQERIDQLIEANVLHLQDVVRKSLQIDPQRRYHNAKEVIANLKIN